MPGFNSNYGGASIYIDASQVMETVEKMKRVMSEPQFHEMMRRTFNDTGRQVKTILRREVPKDYQVTASWVGSQVGWPKTQGLSCVVPISGVRGSIGGRFPIPGQRGRPKKGRRYKINTKILKAGASTLPDRMEHQGGQPPFMMGKVAMTRKYAHKSHPIVRVVGLGVPQMPINRSEEDVRNEIIKVLENRLEHHFLRLFGS